MCLKIFITFLPLFMKESKENLRLRINISHSVKFYVIVKKNDDLDELKKVIIKIAEMNYHIYLKNIRLKSEDGYDILKHYNLGDVLEDNQVLIVDLLEYVKKQKTEAKYEKVENVKKINNKIETKEPVRIKEENVKTKSLKENSPNILNSKSVLTNTPSIPHLSIDIEKKPEIQKGPIEEEENGIEELKNLNNFKGFAVKKTDLTKNRVSKFDTINSFMPLKKRKAEEQTFDII